MAEAPTMEEAERIIREIEADDLMERCYEPGRYEAWKEVEE